MSDDKMPVPLGVRLPFYGVDNQCFKLGDVVYEAMEDPDDGYRSYLGSVVVKDAAGLIFFGKPVDEVVVVALAVSETEPPDYPFNGYVVKSLRDGHEWLRFGTEDYLNYYPGFVFKYQPRTT